MADVAQAKAVPYANRRDPRFVATLELLTFVAQRDLSGLAARGLLAPFVDELRAQIDSAGAVAGVSNYQLMLPRFPSSGLRGHVEDAVRQVQRSLDRIRIESDEVFRRRAKQAP